MQNTRERILTEALGLFAREGYEAVSVRDIARRLNMTPAALYKHYAAKRDIFDCILRRMEENDAARAAAYAVPEGTAAQTPAAYHDTGLAELLRFTLAQFRYWTEDPFAAEFRRMLTLEQYRGPESAALYQQYLGSGVLGYLEDLFRAMPAAAGRDPQRLALELYAPVYLSMSLSDGGRNAAEQVEAHLRRFAAQFNDQEESL